MSDAAQRSSSRSATHGLSPTLSGDDRGRQSFIFHTKRELMRLGHGKFARLVEGDDVDAVVDQLEATASYAVWNSLNQGSQRQMWRALEEMIDAQTGAIAQRAERIGAQPARGSLHLDPDFEAPGYLADTAFHGQPGGYVATRSDSDLRAGLLQEAGGALYTRGSGTGSGDSKAQAVVDFLRDRFPDFAPGSILDLGCGYGGQTCGYAAAYPDAETHGVDVGRSVLRYGHLRAESMGIALHLHQMDASATSFPDQSFDLIVSNILLHEVPTAVLHDIMAECRRLIRPGGIVLHQDVPTQNPALPALQRALSRWQRDHNDEPYWEAFAGTSVPESLRRAGFDPGAIFAEYIPQVDGPLTWYFVGASA